MANWHGQGFSNLGWKFYFESVFILLKISLLGTSNPTTVLRPIRTWCMLGNAWQITSTGLTVSKLAYGLIENRHNSVRRKIKVCKVCKMYIWKFKKCNLISSVLIVIKINHWFLECPLALFCPFSPLLCLSALPLQYHCTALSSPSLQSQQGYSSRLFIQATRLVHVCLTFFDWHKQPEGVLHFYVLSISSSKFHPLLWLKYLTSTSSVYFSF